MEAGSPFHSSGLMMANFSRLNILADALETGVGTPLATHGFSKVCRTVGKSGIVLIFRRSDAYLQLGASFDCRDAPFTLLCALGEGPHDWPDNDWNKVALWRIARAEKPQAVASLLAGLAYSADAGALDFALLSKNCWAEIQRYGSAFLSGDMSLVRKILSQDNIAREPYKIVSRGPDGVLQTRPDQASELLRKKYIRI